MRTRAECKAKREIAELAEKKEALKKEIRKFGEEMSKLEQEARSSEK